MVEAVSSWAVFFEKTRGRPPRPMVREAAALAVGRAGALELGAGALDDAGFLLTEGFDPVVAVDQELVAAEVAAAFPRDRFSYLESTFEAFAFPVAAFDLVSAQFSLPFTHPDHFERVFAGVRGALRGDGIFTGQLFGDRDEWASDPTMTFHTETQARALFSGMDLLVFEEMEDPNGRLATGGTKHWHLFHIIARK